MRVTDRVDASTPGTSVKGCGGLAATTKGEDKNEGPQGKEKSLKVVTDKVTI